MIFSLLLDDESSHFTILDLSTNDDLVNAMNVSNGQEQGVVERKFKLMSFVLLAGSMVTANMSGILVM